MESDRDHQAPPVNFDPSVAAFFAASTDPAQVRALAAQHGKLIMAIVTLSGCPACMALKTSVNKGNAVKQLLPQFVVVNAADGAAPQWQKVGEGYVPQAHFFAPNGNPLAVSATENHQYQYFYPNDQTLADGMQKAWWLVYGHTVQQRPMGAATAMVNVTGDSISTNGTKTILGHSQDDQMLPCFVNPRVGFEDAPAAFLRGGRGDSGQPQRRGGASPQSRE